MKGWRRVSSLVLLLVTVSAGTQFRDVDANADELRHVGKWQGTDSRGKTASISFTRDGHAAILMDGETMALRYVLDYSRTPIWLDVILEDPPGKEVARMRSIVKFVAEDQMLWRIGQNPAERPGDFDENDRDNTVLLKRVAP